MKSNDSFKNAGFAHWNGFNSLLLYVPTGTDDPLVVFDSLAMAIACRANVARLPIATAVAHLGFNV